MIDTDKYEGHSTIWTLDYNDWTWTESMFTAAGETNEADAPLLLAEVIRLRKVLQDIRIDALVMMANGVENAYSIVLRAERGEEE